MAGDDEYLALLNRAKIAWPETIENHERFEIPELDVLQEDKITVYRHFIDVTDKLRGTPSTFCSSSHKSSEQPATSRAQAVSRRR